jgi:hypothetical protein
VYLNQRIDVMSDQMSEIIHHFCTMLATRPGSPSPDVKPGKYAAATSTRASVPSQGTSQHPPVLVPTPDVQGPPPAVATSTANFIGNHPAIPLTYYTPQSQASNWRNISPCPLQQLDFGTVDETRQLHSLL